MQRRTAGNRLRAWVGGPYLLPETIALIARFTTPPTTARSILINDLVGALITAGVWAKLDALYVMAQYDAQAARQNWVADQYNLTAVSSPTFTTDRGYTGDASSSYLSTGFNPTTAVSPKLSVNSTNIGVWSRTDVTQATYFDMGANDGGTQIAINSRSTSANTLRGGVNAGGLVNFGAVANSLGHSVLNRANAANVDGYRDGASVANTVLAASAVPNSECFVLRSSVNYSARQIAIAHIGASFSSGEVAAFYAALNTYLVAVGAA